MKLHYVKNYDQVLFQLLFKELQYSEHLSLSSTGTPSIGYHFDLQNNEVLLYVLEALGFDIHGSMLQGETLVAEYYYIGLLQKAINETHYDNADRLNHTVNDILKKRRQDSRYPSFANINRVASFTLCDERAATGVAFSLIKLYEKKVDDWLTAFDFEMIKSNAYLLRRTTKERAVLVSLAAQGVLQHSNIALAEALINDDRAECWYIIRYSLLGELPNTDPLLAKTTLKQRYFESELFGLYDPAVNEANMNPEHCKSIYDMFNRHKTEIINHEKINRALIAEANNDFVLGGSDTIRTLEESFKIAYNYLRTRNLKNTDAAKKIVTTPSNHHHKRTLWSTENNAELTHSTALAS